MQNYLTVEEREGFRPALLRGEFYKYLPLRLNAAHPWLKSIPKPVSKAQYRDLTEKWAHVVWSAADLWNIREILRQTRGVKLEKISFANRKDFPSELYFAAQTFFNCCRIYFGIELDEECDLFRRAGEFLIPNPGAVTGHFQENEELSCQMTLF